MVLDTVTNEGKSEGWLALGMHSVSGQAASLPRPGLSRLSFFCAFANDFSIMTCKNQGRAEKISGRKKKLKRHPTSPMCWKVKRMAAMAKAPHLVVPGKAGIRGVCA